MGFFGAPPPPSPPTRFDTVGVSASSILLLCAVLCVRNSLRSDGLPSAGIVYQVVGFLINIVSVSIPGRFDSDVDPTNMTFPWPTLFAPAGFAFAIWGVIYLGELLGMGLLVTSPTMATAAAPASRAWACANIAQALWCMSFRPWALSRLWLSSACLAATAASLVVSQKQMILAGCVSCLIEKSEYSWAPLPTEARAHSNLVDAAPRWTPRAATGCFGRSSSGRVHCMRDGSRPHASSI